MAQRTPEFVAEPLLQEACSRYGLHVDDIAMVGGYQNVIYEFERGGESHILRLTPHGLRTAAQVEAELEWIRYLAGHGIPVSAPIPSANGSWLEVVEGSRYVCIATAFAKAPGRRVHYPECLRDPRLAERCGKLTGRIHRLSQRYRPTVRRQEWTGNDYLVNAVPYIPAEQKKVHAQIEQLLREVASLPVDDDCYGLIHGDINVGNFMVDDDGRLTLFDFDECQYSWYVEDIAVQLYYMVYVYGDDAMEDRMKQCAFFMEHFLRGYREEIALPDEWLRRMPLFLRLREIIVYAGMYRGCGMTKLDDWTSDYLSFSRARIERGLSVVDGFF